MEVPAQLPVARPPPGRLLLLSLAVPHIALPPPLPLLGVVVAGLPVAVVSPLLFLAEHLRGVTTWRAEQGQR